jgi:hypothetical protein
MKSVGCALAAMAAVLSSSLPAKADYTTECLLSFDWVIDSSDEIHHVRVESPGDDGPRVPRLVKTLKQLPGTEPQREKDLGQFPFPRRAKPGDEWLLFLRLKQDGPPSVVQWVNLTRPLAHFRDAAVDRRGEPIAGRDALMQALRARLKLGRRPPATSDREAIDDLARANYHLVGPAGRALSSLPGIRSVIGGITIRSGCQYWDRAPHDLDTGIAGIVVPADPEEYAELLAAAKQCIHEEPDSPIYRGRFEIPVFALSNYPCEETEEVLRAIVDGNSHYSLGYRSTAKKVLDYFRYYPAKTTDSLHDKLTGRWRLTGHQERIDLALRPDNSFVAESFDRPAVQGAEPKLRWYGEGHWAVRDRRLSIYRTRHRLPESDAFEKSFMYHRRIFEDKRILDFSANRVVLESGPRMERIAEPADP